MRERFTIGGALAYDIDHARIAHRPTDRAGLRGAAIELRASGLKVADIARCLGIGDEAVRSLLNEGAAMTGLTIATVEHWCST